MKRDDLLWRHCIVANIKHIYTDNEGNTWHGTKVFPGGRKIYISNRYCKKSGEITVMGLNRYKSKYDWTWVPLKSVEKIRAQRVFKPKIVELMGDWETEYLWWGDTREDQYDADAFAAMLISEIEFGCGYEKYLRNRLINGLEGEMIKANTGLDTEGLYSNANLPLEYLYIGNMGYPSEIVRDVLLDYPEYVDQWPRLREYLV